MGIKVSVIIPLYKAESYVQECFRSINAQTYKNVEIIFVDDGSPDRSGQIVDELSAKFKFVKAIHQPNGGASAARNSGVKEATGDYLLFVDADDFLRYNDSLERIVSYAKSKNNPDIVGFNISYYYPSKNRYADWVEYSEKITDAHDKDSLVQELVKSGTLPVSSCGKMIRRDTYEKMGLKFIEGTVGEDIPWTIQLFDGASTICYMDEYHYCYRQEVATSVTGCFSEKKILDHVTIVGNLVPLINSMSFEQLTKDCLYSFAGYELSIAMSNVHRLSKRIKIGIRRELKSLCWLLKYPHNPKVRMVGQVYNLFGYAITERVLRMYNWYRARKK